MEAATTSSSSLLSFQFHHNHHGRPIAAGSRCSILPRLSGVSASLLLSSTFSYSIPKIKPQRKFHRRRPIPITAVFERFTERAIKSIVYAQREAKQLEKDMVFTQHLLLGLITEDVSPKGFLESGVTIEKAREIVKDIWKVELPEEGNSSSVSPGSARDTPFSLSTKRVFEAAVEYSKGMGHNYIAPEHIAIALFTVDDGNALKVLERLGVKIDQLATVAVLKLQGEIANDGREPFVPQGKPKLKPFGKTATGKTSDKRQDKSAVSQFCVDLTTRADEGRIDPVIGRDTEVQRVVQILGRKTKNNPILLGEPGVGKTAIAEGLALRIANAEVPIFLWEKKIMSLDVGLLLSGAKERGELESRITNLIHEVKKDGNIILFIDEVHTLVGSGTVGRGGKGGGLDMANLLKPALARGELRCIASTTLDEHRKYFETDKALARRFQPILVNEPSLEDAKTILMGIRSKYEDHHKCSFTTEAVNAAVYLSARYIPDRFLPDKAIDLLDEAGSRARIDAFKKRKQQQINILSKSPAEYWQEIRSVQTFHELVLANTNYSGEVNATNLGDASSTSTENENNLAPELTLDIAPDEIEPVVVGPDEIATVASLWSGVPVKKLTSDEQASLLDLEKNLQKRVIGQDEAVSAISRAIKRSRTGLKDPKRPIAAMFFCGPTGVGKTELTKALAACYFGSDDAMIRLDMSEYMERHTVSKLIGSPPGYIGYDEGGTLTEAIRRRPFTLVLLDEIEKAHPDIFNILLQVFEDGHLTDSQGRRVSFKNTLIVMTSNVGSQAIVERGRRRIGFEFMFQDEEPAPDSSHSTTKSLVMQQLKQYFRPELLNRIDEVVVFHALKRTHLRQILDIMLAEVRNRLLSRGINLELSERLLSLVCKHGYDPKYGARPLRRAITLLIEDVISDAMLAGAYQRGDTISMDVDTAGQPFVSNPSDHSIQLSSSASL